MTPAEAKRFRRAWRRGGLPPFRATPPQPPVPSPRPSAEDAERMERLLSTGELAAIWDGWKGAEG